MNKEHLISCFQDTITISQTKLKSHTEKAASSSRVYPENFHSGSTKINYEEETRILEMDTEETMAMQGAKVVVEENTTFSVVKKYKSKGKTAVLNFANPYFPGGGVQNGAMAQEECLCRSSNLYFCLDAPQVHNDFYRYHKEQCDNYFSDRIIYTEGVTVFKTDDTVPKLMSEMDWFQTDVITCAAPYLAKYKYVNQAVLKEIFKRRIKNIFETALDNHVKVLILGAFGCGAFKNPPKVVAKAFGEVIEENNYALRFHKIIFAIKSTVRGDAAKVCPNISAFELEFYGVSSELCKTQFHSRMEFPYDNVMMPSGRTHTKESALKYYNWKEKNKYKNKQFSILGDSISTLEGYIPNGYKQFYTQENSKKSGVFEMKDTWWGKVIEFFGGELLVNNSWSGSRVTKLPSRKILFPSGSSNERTSALHLDSVMPDVIILYLGTNDWGFGAVAEEKSDVSKLNYHIFSYAYDSMLKKIKQNYPDSEIWCCTLCETFISRNPSFVFLSSNGGTHIEVYNEIIRKSVRLNNCKLIDLYDFHMPYDSMDGSHPNESGMSTLATMMIRSMASNEIDTFFDCESDNHVYKVVEETIITTRYICKKCGREKPIFPLEPFMEDAITEELLCKKDMTEDSNYFIAKDILSFGTKKRDELIGQLIHGRYRVIKKIGEGGFSRVYLVSNEYSSFKSLWAMQVLDKSVSVCRYKVVMQEAYMMSKLDHPAIPCVVEIRQDERYSYIIMDYIEGTSLEEVVRRDGTQSEETVIDWGKQLCQVLDYLHHLHPPHIYRDVKPSNIMLTSDKKLKLIDFGSMKVFNPKEMHDTMPLGTRGYASPEQYGGLTDARSDIFSLGVTIYYLLTGVRPNRPSYILEPIRQVKPDISKKMEHIISKCIQTNPDDRYQNCKELLNALEGKEELKKGFLWKFLKK